MGHSRFDLGHGRELDRTFAAENRLPASTRAVEARIFVVLHEAIGYKNNMDCKKGSGFIAVHVGKLVILV